MIIVGEAPGETEILLKRPFSGKSGRLLNSILTQVGLDRDEIYVANSVSCHPTRNATPSASAIKACQARLFEEIRVRGPRVVVAMGNSALSAFGVADKISGCRGRERWISVDDLRAALHKGRRKRDLAELHFDEEWRNGGFYLLPTFHPAYVLRFTDAYPDVVKDLGRIGELLGQSPGEKRELPPVEAIVPETVNQCLQWLDVVARQKVVACDIESTSKNVMRDRLLTLAYAWRDRDAIRALVIPAALAVRQLVRRALRDLHCAPALRCVWHNGKFDRRWYKHHLGIEVRIDGDSMLAHYALDERRGIHGLKERASDDLGADDYEAEIKAYVGRGKDVDYGRIPFDKLVVYTAEDVGMTLMLTEMYEAELKEEPESEWVYRQILLPAAAVLSDVEHTGIAVDVAHLRALESEFRAVLEGHERTMRELAGHPFNVSSYPQLVQVLYGDGVRASFPSADKETARGLPTLALPLILNEGKTPATGSDACDKLLQRGIDEQAQQFVRALRAFKLDSQLERTYIKKLPEVADDDGRIRTNYNVHTTRSGRLSSSDPTNLQNVPTRRQEGQRIKNGFVAASGYVLVECDLSQAELRVAAFLSQEPALLEVYRQGRDFHHEVALRILGDEQQAKELRPYVKTLNFAVLYGAEPTMLTILLNDTALEVESRIGAPQPRWSMERVQDLYDEFWRQFPVFKEWSLEQRRLAKTQGYVTSHFGRRRRWYLITRETWGDVQKEASNHPIQSTAADILTLGMIEVHRWLQQRPIARIVATVHDSLLLEVLQGHEAEVAERVCKIIEAIPSKHGIDVPFKVDAKSGHRWGSLVPLRNYAADGTISQSVYKELSDGRISNAA